MEKVIKLIKGGALLFLVAAPIYLANEGQLGVNLTTILSTASPMAVLIVTQVYEVIKYVLPITTVKKLIVSLTDAIGKDNVDYLKTQVDTKGVKYFEQILVEFMSGFNELKKDVALIKERQENVL